MRLPEVLAATPVIDLALTKSSLAGAANAAVALTFKDVNRVTAPTSTRDARRRGRTADDRRKVTPEVQGIDMGVREVTGGEPPA